MIIKIFTFYKKEGLFKLLKLVTTRVVSKIVAIPITIFIVSLSFIIRIRFIKLFSSRIGHYSINTEFILCGIDLNVENNKRCKTIFYTLPDEPICNDQLHQMWKRTIPIFHSSYVATEIDKLLQKWGGKKYENEPLKKIFEPDGDGRDRWNLLGKVKKCHLSFTTQEEKHGKVLLEELGVPAEAPFVCLLVRDASYLSNYMPSADWSYHNFRDADINNYQLAAEYLADQGYYVIRMGKIVKKPFQCNHPKIIDYATSKLRSDFMDIYLSAHCYFYLTTCSGLDSVARVFRKPLLVTNLVLADFDIWHPWDLFIPKKIMDIQNDKILNIQEMNQLYFEMKSKKKIPQLMQARNLQYIDNSPEEIKAVTEEMLARLTGNYLGSEEEEKLQKVFWEYFPKYSVDDNLPQLNIPVYVDHKIRIGIDFLKRNRSMLIDTDIKQAQAI